MHERRSEDVEKPGGHPRHFPTGGGAVRWVLPTALGRTAIVSEVPLEVVREALLASGAEP